MNERLEKIKNFGGLPFDIDCLREIGITIGLDWDGELMIEYPKDIPERMRNLISEFTKGIKKRLSFDGEQAKCSFVGGSLSGKKYSYGAVYYGSRPFCHHIKRGEWEVYIVKSSDDPRAWFVGTATSKKKGQCLYQKQKGREKNEIA